MGEKCGGFGLTENNRPFECRYKSNQIQQMPIPKNDRIYIIRSSIWKISFDWASYFYLYLFSDIPHFPIFLFVFLCSFVFVVIFSIFSITMYIWLVSFQCSLSSSVCGSCCCCCSCLCLLCLFLRFWGSMRILGVFGVGLMRMHQCCSFGCCTDMRQKGWSIYFGICFLIMRILKIWTFREQMGFHITIGYWWEWSHFSYEGLRGRQFCWWD
jgi:hypothetical protein